MAASQNPFFASTVRPTDGQVALTFAAKYYGPCPEIAADTDSPDVDNVVGLMALRKAASRVVRCNLTFCEQGAVVFDKKTKAAVAAWPSTDMASCATVRHPDSKSRRIGLLKIRDPITAEFTWHLFKYYYSRADNMSDCFQFVVDCGLRDIGRAYATQLAAQHNERPWDAPPQTERMVPPTYDAALEEGAEMELPARRGSGYSICSTEGMDAGYLDVSYTHAN
eukprot:m.173231 g.173231  ORF g.173231 m.173231 type:complete len:223 (+) comp13663_c0_seq1:218-886(+)